MECTPPFHRGEGVVHRGLQNRTVSMCQSGLRCNHLRNGAPNERIHTAGCRKAGVPTVLSPRPNRRGCESKVGRDDLVTFLARVPPGVSLLMCAGGSLVARKIRTLGHEVMFLHTLFIPPIVQTNQTDAAAAKAIWPAVQQPRMRTVATKTQRISR
jgi:hypothetical protein